MSLVAWILQILLAVAFFGAGTMKIVQPRDKLAANMGWVHDFSGNAVKGVGVLEVIAAIGLILPAATKIAPVLTPLAAVGVVLLMIGAVIVHGRRHERQELLPPVIVLVLAAVVVWARFGPYHL